ncbi:hypothetical protein [Nocardia sp. NPDC051463]|uniref:hypothetical protein n=1 Tax=Nocardia sp. NPDC051463 TaxID=3154845 RepID=UPI0034188C18
MVGRDSVWARSHQFTATAMACQMVWVYDRPVNMEQLQAFHSRLQRGRLGRVAVAAVLRAAGDRWTADAKFAPLDIGSRPIERSKLNEWMIAREEQDVPIYGGPAWRLAVTELDDGGAAVSLVLSHVLADGGALFLAIVEAVTDTNPDWTYAADRYGRMRLLVADAVAAVRQLAGVVAAVPQLVRLRRSATPDSVTPEPGTTAGEDETSARTGEFVRMTWSVDAEEWHAAAQTRNGTPTTLTAAALADLAVLLGRTEADGRVRIDMPVNLRTGPDDTRANAVALVEMRVDADAGAADLAPLRATMKDAFGAVADITRRNEKMWPVFIAAPRRAFARLVRRPADFVGTELSVVPEIDPRAACIDGAPATAICTGLVRPLHRDYAALLASGGVLTWIMAQVDGAVTIRMSVLHPGAPSTAEELRAAVVKVFDRYGLTPSFWQ